MRKIDNIKLEISKVFRDDQNANSWHYWVNNGIMVCLVLNALVIFLSTYDSLGDKMGWLLNLVDTFTTIVFLIEVSLRIWTADLLSPNYRGFLGRIRYCLTPYGLIDFISTYPCAIAWFFPFSPIILKSFRVLRLLRIFRFMKAFQLLSAGIGNKKQEMLLSFGFLAVITFMLSLILYYVEHAANPESYATGMDSVVWAFLQYIGDPGGFAQNSPLTVAGRIISCIIGILGIAVFAVPAGLIGSGFMEEMEKAKKVKEDEDNNLKICNSYESKLCRFTNFQIVPYFHSIPNLQVFTGLTQPQIIEALKVSNNLRLVNLAATRPIEERPHDQLAVEHFQVNTPYGCKIDRGSKVTIVVTSSCVEPAMGNFGYYLAKIGGFNFISREIGMKRPYKSYYTFADISSEENLPLFMNDLDSMATGEDHWVFYVLAASGGQETTLPTEIHFNYGGKKGDETYDDPDITLHNTEAFEDMYQDLSAQFTEVFDLKTDKQRYYDTSNPNNIMRKLRHADRVNSVSVRIAWSIACWDLRRIAVAKTIADTFNRHFESDKQKEYSPELKIKTIGFGDFKD